METDVLAESTDFGQGSSTEHSAAAINLNEDTLEETLLLKEVAVDSGGLVGEVYGNSGKQFDSEADGKNTEPTQPDSNPGIGDLDDSIESGAAVL